MDQRLIELYVQRGRLRERIGVQRGQLAQELAPVGTALRTADRGALLLRRARAWMASHPTLVTTVIVAVAIWRPRAVWRVARNAFALWRNWSRIREWTQRGLRAL
jgi:hypothetical protein